jgi:hypothetical protein
MRQLLAGGVQPRICFGGEYGCFDVFCMYFSRPDDYRDGFYVYPEHYDLFSFSPLTLLFELPILS